MRSIFPRIAILGVLVAANGHFLLSQPPPPYQDCNKLCGWHDYVDDGLRYGCEAPDNCSWYKCSMHVQGCGPYQDNCNDVCASEPNSCPPSFPG